MSKNNNTRKSSTTSFKQSMRNVAREMRKNFVITTYKKSFDDFATGINELKGISSVAANILGVEEELTPTTASQKVMDAFANHFPSVESGENIFWSVDISASKCVVKTNEYVSFGWKYRYNKDRKTGKVTISDIEMQVTILRENPEVTKAATDAGWKAILNK